MLNFVGDSEEARGTIHEPVPGTLKNVHAVARFKTSPTDIGSGARSVA